MGRLDGQGRHRHRARRAARARPRRGGSSPRARQVLLTDVLDDEGAAVAADLGEAAAYRHLDVTLRGRVDRRGRRRRGALRTGHDPRQQRRHPRLRADREAGRREVPPGDRREPHRHHARHEVGHAVDAAGRRRVDRQHLVATAASGASRWLGAYASSKWAVRGLSKTAALELGRDGIRVNSRPPRRRRHADDAHAGPRAERHRLRQEPARCGRFGQPTRSPTSSPSSPPTRPATSPAPSGRSTAAPPPATAASSTELMPAAALGRRPACDPLEAPAAVSSTSSPSSS